MKNILLTALIFLLSSCSSEEKTYHLLYPIEASTQKVLRLDGYRFLSSSVPYPAAIIVLSNPVQNGGFIDFAFAMSNDTDKTLHISKDNLIFKLSKKGDLDLVSKQEYLKLESYQKPKGFDTLTPKMKKYGCAQSNTKDNIKISDFTSTQKWVWDKYLEYPFKKPDLYLQNLEIKPGETRGVVWKIKIPKLKKSFEKGTLYMKLSVAQEAYTFKFILQSLN